MINIKTTSNKLYKELGKIFGDIRKLLIVYLVVYLSSTFGTLWLRNVLQKPIPLWIAILISLSILFGCAILFLIHSYKNTSKVKNEFVEAEGFKWETIFQNKNVFHVSNIPFCKTHDRRLTHFKDTYDCMEKDCTASIEANMLPIVYKVALSHIERYIRNKKR